jgi:hypothetical protein
MISCWVNELMFMGCTIVLRVLSTLIHFWCVVSCFGNDPLLRDDSLVRRWGSQGMIHLWRDHPLTKGSSSNEEMIHGWADDPSVKGWYISDRMLNFEVILIDEGMIHQWRGKPPAEENGPFWRDNPQSTDEEMVCTAEGKVRFLRDDPRSKGWSTNRWRDWSTNEEMLLALLRVWSTFEGIFHCIMEWSRPLRRWSTGPPMRCDQEHWGWPTVWDRLHIFEVWILLWDSREVFWCKLFKKHPLSCPLLLL